MNLQEGIVAATQFSQKLEDIVVRRDRFTIRRPKRDELLIAYWSLIFELHKGILCLLQYEYWAPAFALLRPVIEALVRCAVANWGPDEVVEKIRAGRYNVSYEKDGKLIDKNLGMGSLFENYLKSSQKALHSLTHLGPAQLNRRFDGSDVAPSYSNEQVVGLIVSSTTAVFLLTVVITKAFEFDEEFLKAQQLWIEYGETKSEQKQ